MSRYVLFKESLLPSYTVCSSPLGMKDGTIQDSQITASSEFNSDTHGKNNARLDRPAGDDTTGAWSSGIDDLNQWIGVEFVTYKHVSGIILQGRSDYARWVTKYKVEYSGDGAAWRYIQGEGRVNDMVSGEDAIFLSWKILILL